MSNLKKIDSIFYKKLGEIISLERRRRGYSLRYLAELTGISRTMLDGYELGTKRIDNIRWSKLCEALQISENIHIKLALGISS
mgnify:FL=1